MAKEVRIGGMFADLFVKDSEFYKGLSKARSELKRFGYRMQRTGRQLTRGISVPLAAVGIAAVAAANQIDKAFSQIRRATGATSQTLKGLQTDFRAVFEKVPESARDVGYAIGELNTRTGLSGKALQDLTQRVLQLNRVTGSEITQTVRNTTRVFGDWSVSTEDQETAMEKLFAATQLSGVQLSKLQTQLVQYGAPLRQFGYSLEEATALLAKWEKEGVNTEVIISGLRMSLSRLAKAGIRDTGAAFKEFSERVKAAKTDIEATNLAINVFGTRATADLAMAIREGRFEIDEMVEALREHKDSIQAAADESRTFSERLRIVRNAATLALEPLGSQILKDLTPLLGLITEKLKTTGEWFRNLSEETRRSIVAVGAIVGLAGPVILAIGAIAAALAALASIPGLVIVALAAAASALIAFKDDILSVVRDIKLGYAYLKTYLQEFFAGGKYSPKDFLSGLPLGDSKSELGGKLKGLEQTLEGVTTQAKEIVREIKNLSNVDLSALDSLLAGKSSKAGKRASSAKEYTADIKSGLVDAHEAGVSAWQSAFENAITGVRFSLTDMLGQVGVGFAAAIANSLAQALNINTVGAFQSPQALGGQIGNALTGVFNRSFWYGAPRPASVQGPVLESGNFTPGVLTDFSSSQLGAAINSVGISMSINHAIAGISSLGKSSKETAKGIGQLGGTALGYAAFGPVGGAVGGFLGKGLGRLAGKAFSLGGPTDPGTLARLEAVKKLDEILEKIGGVTYFSGRERFDVQNINLGAYKEMRQANWAAAAEEQFGTAAFLGATGIGEALEEILGLTEDVGGQIGAALLENVGGSIDGLRALVQGLGLSFEQVEEQLVELGRTGEMSWHQVEVSLQHATAAFQPGLEAFGAWDDALKNVFLTGGRGVEALTQLRNVAIEAREDGIKSLEELRDRAFATGEFTRAELDAVFSAFASRNIQSLDDILAANDRLLGGVIADIETFLTEAGANWRALAEDVTEFQNVLEQIDQAKYTADIYLKVHPDPNNSNLEGASGLAFDYGRLTGFARGGIVSRPTLFGYARGFGLMGEAGPEAILPLARVGGKLGVHAKGTGIGTNINIYVDAQGAAPGVEQLIESRLRDAMDELQEGAVNAVRSEIERGGAFRESFA